MGSIQSYVFLVTPPPSAPDPAQVSSTPLIYARSTKTFNSTFTVSNKTSSALPGVIRLVLLGLNPAVTVVNANGMFEGSPYVNVSAASLAPGNSVSIHVQFSNPTNAGIQVTPVVYSGSLPYTP